MNLQQIKFILGTIERTSFGISVPKLRKLAKKIASDDWRTFLDNNDFDSFEIKLLHAFVIGYVKEDIHTLLKYFELFIPCVDNWAINDSLCQNFKITRKHSVIVWEFLQKFIKSDCEFESRIVSVMLLSHYVNDSYIDRVIQILDGLNTDKYYAQMGVAWAIATIMGKYPDKCMAYLKSPHCHLDTVTYNKSLQKIRESLRVSQNIKLKTRQMQK